MEKKQIIHYSQQGVSILLLTLLTLSISRHKTGRIEELLILGWLWIDVVIRILRALRERNNSKKSLFSRSNVPPLKGYSLSKQSDSLWNAFVQSSDGFLSNKQICSCCGWDNTMKGVNERLRVAISQLRKRLKSKGIHIEIECVTNEFGERGYQLLSK
jgi:DNA-binding winged helix-turn-helix (wHTH) protein